jgi:hypothetical protein
VGLTHYLEVTSDMAATSGTVRTLSFHEPLIPDRVRKTDRVGPAARPLQLGRLSDF